MNHSLRLLTALTLLLGFLSAAAAQVIPNPSFETDSYPQWPGYNGGSNPADISGWVSSPLINAASPGINPVTAHATPNPFADNGAIPDGSQVAFIQSFQDSLATLSTTITGLTSGITYDVSFRANMRAVTSAPNASWSLDGQALVPFTASPAVGGTNSYYLIEGSFDATGATAALHLQNQTPNSTLLVDDFKIIAQPQIYIPDAALSLTGSVTVVETNQRLAFNANPDGGTPQTAGQTNLALAANGAAAFESSRISSTYGDDKLNNGVYGAHIPDIDDATRPWISLLSDNGGWGGVKFAGASTLGHIGFGSRFGNRSDGYFTMQYTTSDFSGVNLEVEAQVETLTWVNIGTLTSTTSGEFGRHLFALTSPVANVTGVRVVAAQGGSTITEIEAYSFSLVVTTLADSGAGSLRDIIANATAGDTIAFDPSLSGMTITLGGTDLLIDKDLTIDASALPGGITIDANNVSRVIDITSGSVVTLDTLTLTGGNVTGAAGGGIFVDESSLTLQNSTITGNTASTGGGVFTRTNLSGQTTTLINCTITNNTASQGGGIFNGKGKTILTHCTITGNTAPAGKGSGVGSQSSFAFNETEVFATIISGNTNSDVDMVFAATNSFTSIGGNRIGTGNATGAFNHNKDQVGITDPKLSPLGDYGGPTQTMPPLSLSPAVNAAFTSAGAPSTDQRGLPRIYGSLPDSGATELQYLIIPGVPTTLADSGGGSLRDVITNASPGDTITLDPSFSGMTITLAGTGLTIDKDLTIDASTLPGGITIDANDNSGVIAVTSGSVVNLDTLTITGGNGSGIYVDESSLTLQNSTITGNSSFLGGGLYSFTNLSGQTTTLINCTLTNNTASEGGGIYNGKGKTILTHCTITGNTAPAGKGSGVASGSASNTNTEVFATIIAGNTNSDVDSTGSNSFTSAGANLIGTGNAAVPSTFNQPNDQWGFTAPIQLAPLGDYGGPTQTMPPLTDTSPAVDAAFTIGQSPSTDQRGLPRIYGPSPDIGAAESEYFIPVVTTLADSGVGSLRDKITNATAGDTITFDPSLSGMTITLAGIELLIDKDLTIDASALPGGITIDANDASRVINITSGNVVILDSLTITGGLTNFGGNPTNGYGGGIRVYRSTLTLQNSTITGNSSFLGGGLYSDSDSSLVEVTTTLINCTLTNNTANSGGGIYTYVGKTILTHCTVTANTGSGVASLIAPSVSETELFATIVSGNTNSDVDLGNSGTSIGANLIGTGDATTGAFNHLTDQVGITDPKLSPLGDYGGPTQTMPPLSASPAVNAAFTSAGAPSTDQRGLPRIIGSLPDSGATELQYPIIPGVTTTLADSGGGSLRDVIANASPGDTITFDPSLSGMTITLGGTELTIDKDLTIDASALPGGITIDAAGGSRVFKINSGFTVSMDSLTLTGGNATGSFPANTGGAIYSDLASLSLTACTLSGNSATNIGGGIFSRGTAGSASLSLTSCTLSGNSASLGGGGILSDGRTGGSATLILNACTLSGNSANAGGDSGGGGGGIYVISDTGGATLSLENTILAGNAVPFGPDLRLIGAGATLLGMNLISNTSGNSLTAGPALIIAPSPMLLPLGDYGGPTQTMPPLSDSSPAVNAAITSAGSPSTDQRGLPRISGNFPDIGAAELQYFIVQNPADSGAGSLRDTITSASFGDIIIFDPSLSGMTITLGGTELLIDKDLTIDASSLPGGITIDANNASRVIHITSGSVVTLDSLTITGGNVVGVGGGISVNQSSLTLQNSTITGNFASQGGGLYSATNLAGVTTTLINCTVTNNTATVRAGGISIDMGKTILTHCTITGNTAPAGTGSGVASFGSNTTEVEVFATIISGNTNSDIDFVSGFFNSFKSADANLIGTGNATGDFYQPKDQVGINNPQLAPLGNYGGPTQTMPPLSVSSPAVDAANTIAGSPSTDQRGLPRIYGSLPDIGATELQYFIVTTIADSGAGSLRDTIASASPSAIINFDPSLSGLTITLGGAELLINKNLTIDASTLPGGITIDANDVSRVIHISSGSVVTLDTLTITGGNAPGGNGGGITVDQSSLTLQNSTITGNSASTGGGLFSTTNLSGDTTTLINCTVTNNSAISKGGGISIGFGKTILSHCTITGNTAPAGEGSGVASFGASAVTETEVFATIISGNTNSDVDFVVQGINSFTSADANLIGTGNATGAFSQLKDQVGITDPQLAPLGDYGGPTRTMPPLSASSPAVNASITIAGSPSTDQRGLPRTYGSLPDIGATELQYFIPVVTTLADSGFGSLRDTIANALAGTTLTFDPSLSGQTITLGGAELLIDKDLTIDASALPGGITIDANNASRVIHITNGNIISLDSLTITGGLTNFGGNPTNGYGGGIRVFYSSLTLKNSTITGNSADSGGGLYTATNLTGITTTLINCTVTDNSTTIQGGGIYNEFGKTILTHCTITGNTAQAGAGSGVASFGNNQTDTEVFATIISGNTNSDVDFVNGTATNSFTSTDANLIGTGNATGNFSHSKDQVGITNPQLAPLGDYGGPTQTMPLLPGSPAIEGGILLGGTPPTDQLGNPRPSGPLPDIGAVEALPISQLMLASTDGDDIPDILEGPGNAYPHLSPSVDDSAVDTDGDGSSDADEIANMTDPLDNGDYLQLLSMIGTANFATAREVTVTLNTFPGLDYHLEASDTMQPGSFTLIPGTAFTATGFSKQLTVDLSSIRDFVRAQRD